MKTKKVGGTSFEIALSKYCDENDIVTLISPEDENTRASLGYQKPVNYNMQNRSNNLLNLGVTGNFRNHMKLLQIAPLRLAEVGVQRASAPWDRNTSTRALRGARGVRVRRGRGAVARWPTPRRPTE